MRAEREIFILLHGEGILKQLEPRVAGLRFIIYRHHVEAPLARKCQVPKVIAGHVREGALLVPVHGSFGGFDIVRGAGLDFDEAQHIFIPTDQVNLSPGMRRTEVSREHHVTAATQVKISVVFAPFSDALMDGQVVRRNCVLGKPVESADGGMGEAAGGHT